MYIKIESLKRNKIHDRTCINSGVINSFEYCVKTIPIIGEEKQNTCQAFLFANGCRTCLGRKFTREAPLHTTRLFMFYHAWQTGSKFYHWL